MDAQVMTLFLPVVIPLVIAGLKLALKKIPGWLLPIIAPILGGLGEAAIAYAAGVPSNPLLGAILGSAGVGVREIVDQVKKAG